MEYPDAKQLQLGIPFLLIYSHH